jgi:RHS repeat-associated protein
VLKRFDLGRSFVGWYYDKGPRAAEWIKGHDGARFGTRVLLSVFVVPLKVSLFGHGAVLFIIFVLSIITILIARKIGLKWGRSTLCASAVAILLVIGYSYLIVVPKAHAAYSELDTYYYTNDHIGRPFNVREGSTLTWYEQHYPFGEIINEEVLHAMTAGAGSYAISWKPNFRFPGQYEDSDMGTAANSRPLFVQNHYREYMPRFGRYNRVDPVANSLIGTNRYISIYIYADSNAINNNDQYGLFSQGQLPGLPIPNPITFGCAYIIYMFEMEFIKRYPSDDSPQELHCRTSCRIKCECPAAGYIETFNIGVLKELGDIIIGQSQLGDIMSNLDGLKCALKGCNCDNCCDGSCD